MQHKLAENRWVQIFYNWTSSILSVFYNCELHLMLFDSCYCEVVFYWYNSFLKVHIQRRNIRKRIQIGLQGQLKACSESFTLLLENYGSLSEQNGENKGSCRDVTVKIMLCQVPVWFMMCCNWKICKFCAIYQPQPQPTSPPGSSSTFR